MKEILFCCSLLTHAHLIHTAGTGRCLGRSATEGSFRGTTIWIRSCERTTSKRSGRRWKRATQASVSPPPTARQGTAAGCSPNSTTRIGHASQAGPSSGASVPIRMHGVDFRKGSGNPRRQSDYNHPHWSAVARPVTGTRGSPGMSLLERANPANTRSYTLGRWHNRQKRLINETSLFGRYVINPRAAKALGSRSRGELSMYPATLDDKGRFRADSNPGLFDTRLKLG